MIADIVLILKPDTKSRVTIVLKIAINIDVPTGLTPLIIKGIRRNIQHVKVNINATNDLTPLIPPIMMTEIINMKANKYKLLLLL